MQTAMLVPIIRLCLRTQEIANSKLLGFLISRYINNII